MRRLFRRLGDSEQRYPRCHARRKYPLNPCFHALFTIKSNAGSQSSPLRLQRPCVRIAPGVPLITVRSVGMGGFLLRLGGSFNRVKSRLPHRNFEFSAYVLFCGQFKQFRAESEYISKEGLSRDNNRQNAVV